MATLNPPHNPPDGNPYIGPRTFRREEGHKFFGRDSEARDLTALIISNRLVLFYAPSGAGKSSLLNTRIGPMLTQEGFEVLPTTRVSGYTDRQAQADNIYVYNLLLSLNQTETEAPELASLSLADFLDNLVQPMGDGYQYAPHYTYPAATEFKPRVLIIDQFEEIVTTNAAQWQQRADFFSQISEALKLDDQLWIVLAMREDFVAQFDPYLHLTPNRLRHRYYMERLTPAAAFQAITQPVAQRRPFAEDAAQRLVENLRRVPEDNGEFRLEQFVEPVQLQAVCYQMWQKIAQAPGTTITVADVERFADVETALSNFYEETIKNTVAETGVSETELRLWFDNELITDAGTRNLVFRGEDKTGSLATDVADVVRSQFILGQVVRSAGTWYELVHDRFMPAIGVANRAWREERPLIQLALAWHEAGRPDGQLLNEQQLAQLDENDWQGLGELVKAYVEVGQLTLQQQKDARLAEETQQKEALAQAQLLAEEQKQRAEAEKRRSVVFQRALWVGGILLLLSIVAVVVAVNAFNNARSAEADALSAQSTAVAEAERASMAEANARSAEVNAVAEAERASSAEAEAVGNAQAAATSAAQAITNANLAATAEAIAVAESNRAANAIATVEYVVTQQAELVSGFIQISEISEGNEQVQELIDDLAETSAELADALPKKLWGPQIRQIDGMVMVYVPSGSFMMGSDPEIDSLAQEDEQPQHEVTLDAFWIDQTEVTNAQFGQFVAATGHETTAELEGSGLIFSGSEGEEIAGEQVAGADWQHPSGPESNLTGLGNHPVVLVSWDDADAYCGWVGGMLPTEAQWEYAARGGDGRLYPWDNTSPNKNLLNYSPAVGTTPVGSYPNGASWVDGQDMSGNVWEWVADWYHSDYYDVSSVDSPTGPSEGDMKVLRGGSWSNTQPFVRAASRTRSTPSGHTNIAGFRCVGLPDS